MTESEDGQSLNEEKLHGIWEIEPDGPFQSNDTQQRSESLSLLRYFPVKESGGL